MTLIIVRVLEIFSLLLQQLKLGCAPKHDRVYNLIFISRVEVLMLQQEFQFIPMQQAEVRIIKHFAEVARNVIQHLRVRMVQLYVDADVDLLRSRLLINIEVGEFSEFGRRFARADQRVKLRFR